MNRNHLAIGVIVILVFVNASLLALAAPYVLSGGDDTTAEASPETDGTAEEEDEYNLSEEENRIEMGENETHPKDPGTTVASDNWTHEYDNGTTINGTVRLNSSEIETHLSQLIHDHREENNLHLYNPHPMMNSSARAKAYDFYDRDYYDHYGPGEESPSEFFRRSGAECHGPFGENINGVVRLTGNNETAAQQIFTEWKNSEGHNRLMLTDFDDTGASATVGVGVHVYFQDGDDYGGKDALIVRAVFITC